MIYLNAYLETKTGRLVEFDVDADYIPEYTNNHGEGMYETIKDHYEINDILINGTSVIKKMRTFCPKKIDEINEQINQDL